MMQKDPVCGMDVGSDSPLKYEVQHETYFFCAQNCLTRFRQNPQAFLKNNISQKNTQDKREYFCPMHPQERSIGPSACLICGMALEPVCVIPTQEKNPELVDMVNRLKWSLLFTLPLFVIGMLEKLPFLQLILSIPVIFWAGFPFFKRAWHSIRSGHANMFTLISIGTLASFFFSVAVICFQAVSRHEAQLTEHGVYFETAAVIVTLVLLGQVLELKAREKTTGAIKKLMQLSPRTALIMNARGDEVEVAIREIKQGDTVIVKPGMKFPVDGTVISGSGVVDESMITGESMPVEKAKDMKIIAATINTNGSFMIRTDKVGGDTMLSKIIRLVLEAQRSRSPIQKQADKVSDVFVPVVILVSIITFLVWIKFGGDQALMNALVNSVSVLIIACPCALGLATPVSITVGMGRAALAGVLFRSAEALELLHKVDVLILDKTGTITEGKPELKFATSDEVLELAAGVEAVSSHPVAKAVVFAAKTKKLKISAGGGFSNQPGLGVSAKSGGNTVLIGNEKFMELESVIIHEEIKKQFTLRSQLAETVLYVARNGVCEGVISVADKIKDNAGNIISALQNCGIRVVMLTGDHADVAKHVADSVGITEFKARMMPQDKADVVKFHQAQGKIVAMAGDGINDSPALAQAQIGIAMGTGTDIAIESAGVTLVKGDLAGILKSIKLSRIITRNIRQNIFFAFIYNSIGVPVAAGVLYPFTGILLSPMLAAVAMSLSSVSVITNALRIKTIDAKQ